MDLLAPSSSGSPCRQLRLPPRHAGAAEADGPGRNGAVGARPRGGCRSPRSTGSPRCKARMRRQPGVTTVRPTPAGRPAGRSSPGSAARRSRCRDSYAAACRARRRLAVGDRRVAHRIPRPQRPRHHDHRLALGRRHAFLDRADRDQPAGAASTPARPSHPRAREARAAAHRSPAASRAAATTATRSSSARSCVRTCSPRACLCWRWPASATARAASAKRSTISQASCRPQTHDRVALLRTAGTGRPRALSRARRATGWARPPAARSPATRRATSWRCRHWPRWARVPADSSATLASSCEATHEHATVAQRTVVPPRSASSTAARC